MKRDRYLICYDIANPKRLNKLARMLQKRAYRIQYSVFFIDDASDADIYSLAEDVRAIIDEEADDVRIYRIKDSGVRAGCAVDLDNPYMWVE